MGFAQLNWEWKFNHLEWRIDVDKYDFDSFHYFCHFYIKRKQIFHSTI